MPPPPSSPPPSFPDPRSVSILRMGMRPIADERVGRIFATFVLDLLRPPTVFAVVVFMRRPVSGFCPEFFDEYGMAFLVGSTEPSGGRTCRIPHTRHRPRRIDVRRGISDLGLLDGLWKIVYRRFTTSCTKSINQLQCIFQGHFPFKITKLRFEFFRTN